MITRFTCSGGWNDSNGFGMVLPDLALFSLAQSTLTNVHFNIYSQEFKAATSAI